MTPSGAQAMTHDKAREALIEAIYEWLCDDVLPAYGIDSRTPRQDPETKASLRVMLAALRTPEALEAVKPLAEFGLGNLGVDTGTVHGKPAVFIRPLDHTGIVGDKLPDEKQIKGPQASLESGEFYLAFPTMEHAERVADALTTPPEPDPTPTDTDKPVVTEAMEFDIGEFAEGMPWTIERDHVVDDSGKKPCKHCVGVRPADPERRPDGSIWSDGYTTFVVPAVVCAQNEGGHNGTVVCLSCIMEAALAAALAVKP